MCGTGPHSDQAVDPVFLERTGNSARSRSAGRELAQRTHGAIAAAARCRSKRGAVPQCTNFPASERVYARSHTKPESNFSGFPEVQLGGSVQFVGEVLEFGQCGLPGGRFPCRSSWHPWRRRRVRCFGTAAYRTGSSPVESSGPCSSGGDSRMAPSAECTCCARAITKESGVV